MRKQIARTVALVLSLTIFSACGETESTNKTSKNTDTFNEISTATSPNATTTSTTTTTTTMTTTTMTTTTTCSHEWIPASCTEPQTCSICGETEGSALGHDWLLATCTEPETCSICGETKGSSMGGHKWRDATCTEPKTCSVCGETEGSALGHNWEDATYDDPKTCKTCGETEGSPLEKTMPTVYLKNSLPFEVDSYSWSGDLKTTGTITQADISVEENYSSYDIILSLSGEKTYDVEGTNYSRYLTLGIKVYDSDGYVVDDATYYSPDVAVGEKFRNDEEKLYYVDLEPGETYYIELMNTK